MDRSLYERAVKLHGSKFDRLVKEEQGASFQDDVIGKETSDDHVTSALNDENATKSKEPATSAKIKNERKRSRDEKPGDNFTNKLHGFIARKADLLFRKQSDDEDTVVDETPSITDAETLDYYAILPPLEQFLEVDPDVCQERLFDILKVGDVVVGQILSTKEFGIFVKLLALGQGMSRFLDECEVVALLPAAELRDKFSHVASVDDFQIGDLLRALVIKVNPEEQKVIISLHAKDDSQDSGSLGLIAEPDLPVHYRRSVLQMDTQETYQDMLHNSVGFDNPFNVSYLGTQLQLKDACPLSLMRGLQRSNFPKKEYAEPLRKWQTNRWSMESVAKGVEHFKAGRLLDAMQHLNKALEIDEENVEAFVARGALYANQDLLSKALQDFGKALKINPNHRNANKYMCQTLIERGKQHEEAGEMDKAADCYQTAVDIKPDFLEAQLCLDNVNRTRKPAKKVSSPEYVSSPSPNSPEVQLSVEALRQLVDPEKDVLKSAKKSTVKSKKKKKKKDADQSSRRRSKDDNRGRSPGRNYKRKRRYSSFESSETSSSRSRSHHRSGKKDPGDGRKHERSSSRKSKKKARRESQRSVSYSRSSSSDRSQSHSSRSKSHQQRRRESSKHAKKRKDRRSSSISRSSSSGSSYSSRYQSRSKSIASTKSGNSSSKRKSEGKPTRSRSRSPYRVKESSLSPQRSKSGSLDRSRKKSKTEELGSRSSKKKSKATRRSHSRSASPSRQRTLSGSSKESRSKMDSLNTHSGQSSKKVDSSSGVRETKKDGSQSKPKSDPRRVSIGENYAADEIYKSKKSKYLETSTMKSSSSRREQEVQGASDEDKVPGRLKKRRGSKESEEHDKVKLKDSRYKEKSSRHFTEAGDRLSAEKKRTSRKQSCSDSYSSSDERNEKMSKKHPKKGASLQSSTSDRSKMDPQHSHSTKSNKDRDRKSPGHRDENRRSRSRSFSSDGSYSSYSSYSTSGSRSYSYSSYSSSGSYSDSDDSHKYSRHKTNKSKSHSKQSKASNSKTSEVREDRSRVEPGGGEEDDSDSDVDTGIYEISRDHLEMYMDSKSYQLKTEEEVSPLKRRKRSRSNENEDLVASDTKTRPGKRKRKNTSDDDKEDKISSSSSGKKESQRKLKPDVAPLKVDLEVPPVVPPLPPPSQSGKEKPSSQTPNQVSLNLVLEPHVQVVHHQSLGPDISISRSTAPNIGLSQSVNRNQVAEQTVPAAGRTDSILLEQHSQSENQRSFISEPQSHRPGTSLASQLNKEEATHKTHEVEHPEMFTQEQLSVINSISNQLVQSRQAPSHPATSGKSADSQYCPRQEREQTQGSSEDTSHVQGHQIGVIMTPRSSNTFGDKDDHRGMIDRTSQSFNDHQVTSRRRRWDVEIPENRGFDSVHQGGSETSFAERKPIPISLDYQHGKDISSSFDNKSEDYRASEAFTPGLPRGPERHMETHGMHSKGGSVFEIEKLIKESRERSRQETETAPRHISHHSRGERSHDMPRGESSEFRTYSTRHEYSESKNVERNTSGGIQVQVVDYQHGKSDVYRERQKSVGDEKSVDNRYERTHDIHRDRHSDRHNERHYTDHRTASPERRHHHKSPRRSHEHRSEDRRHYRDRDRHGDRHGDTPRDRYHSRSRGAHSGRTRRSAPPVEPKESNPFLQLVSSTKDMQVASLHSEGKWGHDSSSPEDVKSSSRHWWL